MNGLQLCDNCKGLWVYFGSEKYPKFCPSCIDAVKKKDVKKIEEFTEIKTQNINFITS